jgi:hypothetical protein
VRAATLAVLGLLVAGHPCAAIELDFGIAKTLEGLSLPVPVAARPVICHGFGCAYQTPIALHPADRAQIRRFFVGSEDAIDERRALAKTMAWYDRRVAGEAGTLKAKARAGVGSAGDPSQFDCLDRTTNTIGLMLVISEMGLLRYHEIDTPVSRGGLASLPHTTAVMRERSNGQKWAVDAWTHNSGEYPDILKLEVWKTQS